jgi:hypothetical protein
VNREGGECLHTGKSLGVAQVFDSDQAYAISAKVIFGYEKL